MSLAKSNSAYICSGERKWQSNSFDEAISTPMSVCLKSRGRSKFFGYVLSSTATFLLQHPLQTLKHPNIVRLYDVIETDKYIGIILEYASGGELFDHILAHRYLREKDACKLFSQLLSGVWYIHQKKIVHRDLKLENLLLDRQRNVIITDFGFANRFEHRADDLMQTSCGSPCYAAPELVISDGLYVGSAVDIWSCGVILYAMLAGYLPFDDDPANPDGDNINLLYKYIVNTPLSFPEYISAEARDLLSIMLVPDPVRRADLGTIMQHHWLKPYAYFFDKSVEDLERTAMEQHHQKRLAYQKQMRQNVAGAHDSRSSRAVRADGYGTVPSSAAPGSRNHRHAQPEFLYETPADQSVYQSPARRGVNSAIVMPTSPSVVLDDDPFAPTPSQEKPVVPIGMSSARGTSDPYGVVEETREQRTRRDSESRVTEKKAAPVQPTVEPVKMSPDKQRKGGFRHTIQVEPPEPEQQVHHRAAPSNVGTNGLGPTRSPSHRVPVDQSVAASTRGRRSSATSTKPLPATPIASPIRDQLEFFSPQVAETAQPVSEYTPTTVAIEVTSPPVTPLPATADSRPIAYAQTSSGSNGSTSSKQSRHKKGLSIDKIGIGKIFGSGSETQSNGKVSRAPSQRSSSKGHKASTDTITATTGKLDVGRRPSTMQVTPSAQSTTTADNVSPQSPMLAPPETASKSKGSRRNTLTVMVEPFRKQLSRGSKTTTPHTPAKEKMTPVEKEKPSPAVRPIEKVEEIPRTKETVPPTTPFASSNRAELDRAVPASTVKASKVMGWFRSKSKGKPIVDEPEKMRDGDSTHQLLTPNDVAASSSSSVSGAPVAATPTPVAEKARPPPVTHSARSASANNDTSFASVGLAELVWRKNPPKNVLRTHQGAVDQTMVTTILPPDVMKQVTKILEGMGVEIQQESDYKYRCIRPKRKKIGAGLGLGLREGPSGLAAFTMVGSAASNGVSF